MNPTNDKRNSGEQEWIFDKSGGKKKKKKGKREEEREEWTDAVQVPLNINVSVFLLASILLQFAP